MKFYTVPSCNERFSKGKFTQNVIGIEHNRFQWNHNWCLGRMKQLPAVKPPRVETLVILLK